MSTCDMIRQCAMPYMHLLDDIEKASSTEERKRIGQNLTNLIASCLKKQGKNCIVTGADTIRFPGIVTYDVIQGLTGTGKPQISCHKFNYENGTSGNNSILPDNSGNGNGFNIGQFGTIDKNTLITIAVVLILSFFIFK